MRVLLPLAFALVATAAQAERLAFDCNFATRCDAAGCEALGANYQFRLDTEAGTGDMIADGLTFPGWYLSSTGLHHFVFVNDAGSEMTSIAENGQATYSGHMAIDGQSTWYRLEGQCTARTK
jgi:hypothetical protein